MTVTIVCTHNLSRRNSTWAPFALMTIIIFLAADWSPGLMCPGLAECNSRLASISAGQCQQFVTTHHRSSHERSCSTLSPVSAGMGDRLRAGIPPRCITKPTKSTQPCIPLRSLNRVPALIGWGNGGNVTLCDPIWHVSSRSGAVL